MATKTIKQTKATMRPDRHMVRVYEQMWVWLEKEMRVDPELARRPTPWHRRKGEFVNTLLTEALEAREKKRKARNAA